MDLPFMISCTVIISSGLAPIMTWNCLQPKKKRWHENRLLRCPNNLTQNVSIHMSISDQYLAQIISLFQTKKQRTEKLKKADFEEKSVETESFNI